MKNCLGIINLTENDVDLGSLCQHRPVAMLPFAGRYRLIDFALSNMVNGGISSVGVFTGNKVRSVVDHLGAGQPWDLDRKINGLFTFSPTYSYNAPALRPGDLSLFYQNNAFIEYAKQEHLFFCKTYLVANIDLKKAYESFLDSNADITILYKKVHDPSNLYLGCDKILLDDQGAFKNIGTNLGMEDTFNLSLEMFFIKKGVYFDLFNEAIEKGNANFLKQAIFNKLDELKVSTFEFDGTVLCVDNVKNYHHANMQTLKPDIAHELFSKNGLIYTKVKDEPSTFYKNDAKVRNCFVANGCEIDGFVENSIIFRGVKIGKNCIVRNSIVMQKSVISENTHLNYVILDKRATVEKDVTLIGDPSNPFVSNKQHVIKKEVK